MDDIIIRKILLDEISELQAISRQTFFETFADHNTADNMQKYLDENLSIDKLINEWSNPNSEFYFASIDGKIIAYLKINTGEAQTELKGKSSLEIERIYVLKDYHGKKVGQILYDKAIEIARQRQVDYVWLGVWEKNLKAIQFYRKNGFVAFDKHIFKLGDERQTDLMMHFKFTDPKS